jgi:hypothetical protein
MLIRLRPGQARDHALLTIQTQRDALDTINGDAKESLRKYLEWVTTATTMVGSVVMPAEVDRLVYSPTYDRLLQLFAAIDLEAPLGLERSRVINGMVQAETVARRSVFDAAIADLRAEIARWSGSERLVVCDTNFYLHHSVPFGDPGFADAFGEHRLGVRLIVPMIVVEELDRAKLGRDEVRGRAQVTLAKLDALFADPSNVVSLEPAVLKAMPGGVSIPFGGLVVELLFDPPGHLRVGSADSEIIERALAVQALAARKATLVTCDTNMSLKARMAGLDVLKLTPAPRPPSVRQARRDRQATSQPAPTLVTPPSGVNATNRPQQP